MASVYVGSVEYAAVPVWQASHVYAANSIVRQVSPALNAERCFKTTAGGTSAATEPVWVTTAASTTTPADGTIPTGATGWVEVTGLAAGLWTTPHARLANAFAAGWSAAGDDIWVSGAASPHAETQSSALTLTAPGTATSPNRIICVNPTGVAPVSADLRTTASITTTGATAITIAGAAYFYGITLNCGSGAVNATLSINNGSQEITYENCALKVVASGASGLIFISPTTINAGFNTNLVNTPVSFGAAGQGIATAGGRLSWRATPSAIAGTSPTNLFLVNTSSRSSVVQVNGCDLSGMSAGTLVGLTTAGTEFRFRDCKLGATTALSSTPGTPAGPTVDAINCNTGAINYTSSRVRFQATMTTDATVFKTTGGASDGTTPISWKVVTNANNKRAAPFECFEIDVWSDTTGSHTVVLDVCPATAVTLKDIDVWMEVFSLNTAGAPVASRTNTAPDILNAGTSLTASGNAWTGSGLGTPQKITSASFTTALKGWIRVMVYVAKASDTIWIDPNPKVT